MENTIVVSRSAKKKMTNKQTGRVKANTYTKQVIYKESDGKGKFISQTRHEIDYR